MASETLSLRCDVEGCNESIYYEVQDLRETEPIVDEAGRLWAMWEPDGPRRRGCKQHMPEPGRHTRRDGTADSGIEWAMGCALAVAEGMMAWQKST